MIFSKSNLTKRILAIFLSFILALSSLTVVGLVPTMEAFADSANINLTQSYVGITAADANRYSASGQTATLNIVNDQQDSNFSIGYVNIDISSFDSDKEFDHFPLTFGRSATSNSDSQGLKFWYTGNTNGDSLTTNGRVANNSNVTGTENEHLAKAITYYGLTEIATYTKDEFNGSTFPVTIDVAAAANATLARGGTRLVIMITQPQSGGKAEAQRTGNRGSDGWTDTKVTFNKSQSCTVEFHEKDNPNKVVYKFNGANTTFSNTNTPYLFTDNTNSTYITGAQWGTTASHNSDGYVAIDNATITSVKSSDKKTSGDAISGVNGKHWSISMKYQYNYTSDNAYTTLFGIGSHNSVTTQSGGQTQDATYMTNGRFGSDLIQVYKDGRVYILGQSTSESVSGTLLSDSTKTITYEYVNDTIKILIDGVEAYSKQIEEANREKFEAGPGNFFIGTSAANLAGGTWHYYGRTNTGYAIHSFKLYEINGTVYSDDDVLPEEVVDDYAPDTTAIDNAMKAFEDKVKDGTIFNNVNTAYNAYVDCQKARDAAVYGHDKTVDLVAKANALNTAINNMTAYSFSYTGNNLTTTFSTADNASYNQQYFKSALYIKADNDPCVVYEDTSGWSWFGMYMHEGTYIYDGTNEIHIPVMLNIQPKDANLRIYGAYLSGQQAGLSLGRKWFGSDGGGSDRIYWKYENYTVLKNQNSGYGSRSFTIPNNNDYTSGTIFKINGACSTANGGGGTSDNRNGWNLFTTNYINVDGSQVCTDQKTATYTLNLGNLVVDQAKDDTVTTIGKRVEKAIGEHNNKKEIIIVNYKGVKDRVQTHMNKMKSVTNYKEGGLSSSAYGIQYFTGYLSNINAGNHGVPTYVTYINTVHTSLNSADASSPTDSTAYANLRTELDECNKITKNDKCYSNYAEFCEKKAVAREAMKAVNSNGYTGTYSNMPIQTIRDELNTARQSMVEYGDHYYAKTGTLNKANHTIDYNCSRQPDDPTHCAHIDCQAFMSAADALGSEIKKTDKYTQDAIDYATDVIGANTFTTEEGSESDEIKAKVSYDNIQDTLQTFTTNLLSALTNLQERNNLKSVVITYRYIIDNDENTVIDGEIRDNLKYGDVITNSYHALAPNQHVTKWTVEKTGNEDKTLSYNPTTNLNYTADGDAILNCYIETDDRDTPDLCTVQFIDKAGRVRAIQTVRKGTTFTVSGHYVTGDKFTYEGDKLPYYDIRGYKVGATGTVITSDGTFTVNGDANIYTVYEAGAPIKITAPIGDFAINNDSSISTYNAKWDEVVRVSSKNDSKRYLWFVDGVLLGSGVAISFRANKSVTFTVENPDNYQPTTEEAAAFAQYNDQVLGRAKVDYFEYDESLNRVTSVVTFAAFDGTYNQITSKDRITEAGVYLSTKASTKDAILAAGKKYSSTKFTDTGNQVAITVSRTAKTSFTMYALPYVIVDGHEYYGTIAECNYAGAQA